MRRTLAVLLVVLLLAPAAGGGVGSASAQETVDCSFPVSTTDATGTAVTVDAEPERVVALQPSAAQTMWEIGAREKVVGMPVNAFTAYLNGSTERTNVLGTDGNVIQEQVVALEPDLVLAPNIVDNATVENLRDAGLTVYKFRAAGSLGDVYEKTRRTGLLVGRYTDASERSARMEVAVTRVREAAADQPRPTVLYLFGESGFTAGPDTFIGELIETAGGQNVAATANISTYGVISPEVIAAEDPEWIVIPEGRSLPANDAVNGSTAVREGQVLRVDDNFLNQPGPRNVQPLQRMAAAFHPEAYAGAAADPELPAYPVCAADVSPTATQQATATATATEAATATGTTAGAGSPGFAAAGAVAALLVVGAVLAAARRR
jgi:iron complex transport system substrate-binding protein